ncbi:hypothetical protein [Pantoea eucrina]|uniref:Uncharacterized protein n=1 Tax=Pantoea eucrina TaxID=472693 RepID=A0ABU5LIW4_9GAMM|nr:hypothetical protein [Pantoea eucrina]MDZ7279625.1 hypothetical protein [Pantoea eucrina]
MASSSMASITFLTLIGLNVVARHPQLCIRFIATDTWRETKGSGDRAD